MTGHISHNNSNDYVCMDKDAEPIANATSNKEGALFFAVRTTCGSLRCPPCKNHTDIPCVACTTYMHYLYMNKSID